MKRTFNFTGRTRIVRDDIRVRVDESSGTFEVDLSFDLSPYPDGAVVVAEAYERTAYERHELGTASGPLARGPFAFRRVLPESAKFRVKVVDHTGSGSGRILAAADGLSPTEGEGDDADGSGKERVSLLHAIPVSLDGQIWRVSFDSERFPVLQYEKTLAPKGFRTYLATDPHFKSLVMPGIARQILTHVLIVEPQDNSEDGSWPTEWLKLGSRWSHAPVPEEEDEPQAKLEWIDDAVAGFCRSLNVVEFADQMLSEGLNV